MADVLKYNEFVKDMQGVICRRNGVTTFVGHRRGRAYIGEYNVNKYLQTPPRPGVLFARLRFSVVMSQVAVIYADKAELERWRVRWRVSGGQQKTLRGFIISSLYTSYSPALPAGYQACEFLQSDGQQYIRLSDLRGQATILYLSAVLLDDNAYSTIIGNSVAATDFLLRRYNRTKALQYFAGGENKSYNYVTGQRIDILNNVLYIGGNIVADALPLPLFAREYALFGAAYGSTVSYLSSSRLFAFAVITDLLSLYLVPALDDNGKPCLYDYIGGLTYYNEGTGEFTYKLAE